MYGTPSQVSGSTQGSISTTEWFILNMTSFSHKIVFSLPGGFELGGVTNWTIWLVKALREAGYDARIVVHGVHLEPPEDSGLPAESVHVCPGGLAAHAGSNEIREYAAYYRQFLPAVFIPNYTHAVYAACALLRSDSPRDVRMLGWAHTDDKHYRRWLVWYAPGLDFMVGVSGRIADRLRKALPRREKEILSKPYGVEVGGNPERTWSNAPASPLKLAYAGRIIQRQKQIWRFVELAEALRGRGIPFELHFAGDGPERQRLEVAFRERGFADAVRFHGRLPAGSMSAWWRGMDCLVLTSDYEGTSISMLEAMAQGCVPVVPDISGTHEVVEPDTNGLVYPVGRIDCMADAIGSLSAGKGTLATMGGKAHQAVAERFSREAYTEWFENLLDQAVHAPPRAWPSSRLVVNLSDRIGAMRPRKFFLRPARRLMKALGINVPELRRKLSGKSKPPLFP